MNDVLRISEVAKQLQVSPHYLRLLEWEGRVPPDHRDFNGRIYTSFDVALLRSMGVGTRPRKLKRAEDVLEASQ